MYEYSKRTGYFSFLDPFHRSSSSSTCRRCGGSVAGVNLFGPVRYGVDKTTKSGETWGPARNASCSDNGLRSYGNRQRLGGSDVTCNCRCNPDIYIYIYIYIYISILHYLIYESWHRIFLIFAGRHRFINNCWRVALLIARPFHKPSTISSFIFCFTFDNAIYQYIVKTDWSLLKGDRRYERLISTTCFLNYGAWKYMLNHL